MVNTVHAALVCPKMTPNEHVVTHVFSTMLMCGQQHTLPTDELQGEEKRYTWFEQGPNGRVNIIPWLLSKIVAMCVTMNRMQKWNLLSH